MNDIDLTVTLCRRSRCGQPVAYEDLMHLRGGKAVHITCPTAIAPSVTLEDLRYAMQTTFEDSLAADRAWQTALKARYGKSAGNARYESRGTATPELKALSDDQRAKSAAAHSAWLAWHEADMAVWRKARAS